MAPTITLMLVAGAASTGLGSGTAGHGIGGAHSVVTNDNLSNTPILQGQGVVHATAGNEGYGSGTGAGSSLTGAGTGSGGKGSEYDATGGNVDDRSLMQKGVDAVKPGSQVGSHTK